MSKPMPVPPELNHLIEKRDALEDRRSESDRRQTDLGPLDVIEAADSLDDVPTTERRGRPDRRESERREAKK